MLGSAWANNSVFSWSQKEPEFLDAAQVFRLDDIQREGESSVIQGHIAKGYYVYRHSLKLLDKQGNEIRLTLPEGVSRHDEFFGDTRVYMGDDARMSFAASASGPLTLHWQGCAEAGICYPPETIQLGLSDEAPIVAQPETLPEAIAGDDQLAAQQLETLGPVWGTLLFFGFGLLLAFTPCSLPMIPIISTMVVGSQAKPRRAFTLSLSYVVAMAGTYAVAGVIAGLAGANLQATLQSPWLLGPFAALFLVLSFSLFGLFELRLPSALMNRLQMAGNGKGGGGVLGAAVLGFLSALLVGPCMTAPLAGALLYIGQTGSALYGGLALFALGLGMGAPLLAIAVFGARALPQPGAWMERVRVVFGYLMIGMAIMMLTRFLPETTGLALWGAWVLLIATGLFGWAQVVAATRLRLAWVLRSVGTVSGLWSVLMLAGAASGGHSLLQPLSHLQAQTVSTRSVAKEIAYVPAKSVNDMDRLIVDASARGQWTLVDFYADWCVSCHVIEREVFGTPEVVSRLSNVQVVRPDVTKNDAIDKQLLKHWGVMGPPTLMLIGPDGQERRALRIVGEIDAKRFLERLDATGEL